MTDDDRVFKALADPTRRRLLDRLFSRDGRTLSELESDVDMTRFGVMKHLRLLEEADLVVTRRSGREKLHFLNVVPIQLIHDRWIDKYTVREVTALVDLKSQLEHAAAPSQRIHIRSTEDEVLRVLDDPKWRLRHGMTDDARLLVERDGSRVCVVTVPTDAQQRDWPVVLSDLKSLLETGSGLHP